jgi:RNA polymerase sigma factor (sigma-70 family)
MDASAERSEQLAELLAAAAAGSEDAWERIIARFSGLLWTITRTYRLGHADAADVIQVTWLRLVQHSDSIRDPERLGAWLATTARRECLRVLRASERVQPMPEPPSPEELPRRESLPELITVAAERDQLLRQALHALSPRCQKLLGALMSGQSLSYAEVSATLDMPVGAIGPTRARCLDCLRRQVARLGLTDALDPAA